ncbi:MAG: hypothetical protein M1819_003111 [Sarea resinae]|nr:MAG: hypothetical protein M1819_003111 [Sarea resinae]
MDMAESRAHLSTHSRKRKAAGRVQSPPKRSRASHSIPTPDAGTSDYEDFSCSAPSSPSGQDDPAFRPQSRPLTPSASPRKPPSEFKTHHCPYENCDRAFNRPARLAEHIRSHTNERPFKCNRDGCNKDFLREAHLSHHIKSAHTDIRDYTCDWEGCCKSFLTATRLRRHQAAHEGREKYRCTNYPPCSETFRKHATLQRHIAASHLNQKPFPCSKIDPDTGLQCSEGFDTSTSLRKHERRAHGDQRFWCSECTEQLNNKGKAYGNGEGIGFASYSLLQEHTRIVHPPKCIHCDQACKTQRELRQHVDIHHSGIDVDDRRTHICDYPDCGRGFTKKFNLTVHIRTVHGGERRFVCGETDLSSSKDLETWSGIGACGRGFSSKASLEEHVRTAHLGLERARKKRRESRPVSMDGVKKKTSPVSAFDRLTGAGYAEASGRDITCLEPGCQYRFLRQYDLAVHLKAKHGLAQPDNERRMTGGAAALTGFPFCTGASEDQAWPAPTNNDEQAAQQVDVERELERRATEGGAFWLGDDTYSFSGGSSLITEQMLEPTEMQRLLAYDRGLGVMELDGPKDEASSFVPDYIACQPTLTEGESHGEDMAIDPFLKFL